MTRWLWILALLGLAACVLPDADDVYPGDDDDSAEEVA